MTKLLAALFTIILSVGPAFSSMPIHSLFSDHRAMGVDDILTVMIVESAKAGSESRTNTNKENSFGVEGRGGTGALDFLPSLGASGGKKSNYDGRGGTSRQGNLVATVSARIINVMDNGNLVIEGSKVVEINQETEIIKITGIVRPQDIQKNNIVYSSSIADAQITYSGTGTANTAQRPGLFTRFINWLF
ncbi:flagellar basal body L-ring protein FlgH [Chitinispirillales bacterium ANBcel5]|uniref:flagellar basal body L-ring protein FlgH n=1 Tax=Cellulosispirillum alkaliphilum TaxID=3039283 RepID=UPI002A5398B6|nr:flagellar basal body L-ring protein FlgH [Chitinispirillales bacterium ANBcel5]